MPPTAKQLTYTIEPVSRLRRVAVCSCGWRSLERYSSELLGNRWHEHAAEVHQRSEADF